MEKRLRLVTDADLVDDEPSYLGDEVGTAHLDGGWPGDVDLSSGDATNDGTISAIVPDELPDLEWINAASLDGKPVPPRQFHVPGLIPAREITLLTGDVEAASQCRVSGG